MLRFIQYEPELNGNSVVINPRDVSAVIEDERSPAYGFARKVALILLRTGQEVIVLDDDRLVCDLIDAAQQASESDS